MNTTTYHQFFFDFDSTLVDVETFDFLASHVGLGEPVSEMTRQSMNGEVPLHEVFEKKVDLVAPHRTLVESVSAECKKRVVEGAQSVIAILHELKKDVYVVTSGLRQIIEPTATMLGISEEKIIANDLYFDELGNYAGMSGASPLCQDGGKVVMVKQKLVSGTRSVFVGDSLSDLLCQEVVDLFVGFGGVVERDIVKRGVDVFVADENLTSILPLILTQEEQAAVRHLHNGAAE